MPLSIQTFDNRTGGHCFFKALGHPLAAPLATALKQRMVQARAVAIYDPLRQVEPFDALYTLTETPVEGVYVQDIEHLGDAVLGHTVRPVSDLAASAADCVFVVAFQAERLVDHIRHLIPAGAAVVTLDEMRLDPSMLTNPGRYLDPLNFATNFAFFRDGAGHHTRIVTANYWGGYGAGDVSIWCRLFDANGAVLADWRDRVGPAYAPIAIDSRDIRARFDLPEFSGQLFLHVVGAAGHDVVKYALDTYGDDETVLSCTHDANAWPADLYAGLPAPQDGERVVLWVQNSHPAPIPPGAIGLNRMGADNIAWLDRSVPGFGSYPLDVASLLPDIEWPAQIEILAGRHMVRPRYEITKANGRRRISHPNVERIDLKPDPKIPELSNLMGKGYLLPAPVLPAADYVSEVLPTPMATTQATLPVTAIVYDRHGQEIARHRFGCLARDHAALLDLASLAGDRLDGDYGHVELVYDFAEGGEADGWLHALFRYTDRRTGHAAETSFGAHMFNHVLTYRNEPQSYAGRAPGLSTRLFLRTGPAPVDTLCHLIYPTSTEWRESSDTRLVLHDGEARPVAERTVRIPLSGSYLFRHREVFDEAECAIAGDNGYILIRDLTCRLFGYHGLIRDGRSFSLDHMFGF